MRCRKCGSSMEKDYDSRTATCPYCGRTVSYRSKADKRRGYRYYPEYDDNNNDYSYSGSGSYSSSLGCISFILNGIIVLLVAIVILVLVLAGVFQNGFWQGIGNILMFFVNIIWGIIKFIATTAWSIITGLFHLIFG